MPFLVYIAILLVAGGSILLELDWLTKPKLESKAPMPVASTALPPAGPLAIAKADGPNADLSPVYPKKPDAPRSIESVTGAPQSAEPAQQSQPAAVATTAKAEPPQKVATEITGAATPPEHAEQSTVSSATVTSNNPDTPRAAVQNRCDVQACASAYQSFRASDCTYQPFEGARRVCEKPPETGRKVASQPRAPGGDAAARQQDKDAKLRDAVRRVRQIAEDADEDEADIDPGMGESRVIVIERPARRPW